MVRFNNLLAFNIEISIYDVLRKISDFLDKRIDIFDLLAGVFKKSTPNLSPHLTGQMELKFN